MHELSIASAIVDTVTRHAAGRPVTVVHLRVGHLRQVVPESLEFYFEHVARDTVCAQARLEIDAIEARMRCSDCGHGWTIDSAAFRCPACGSAQATVTAGDELEVESIEVEEAPCIA
jgi:hydrogenase nickel incorporation protein HypA/HybF